MLSGSNQLAYDPRHKESFYSGPEQSGDGDLQSLVEDYSRLSRNRDSQAIEQSGNRLAHQSGAELGRLVSAHPITEDVDKAVAPFSKRHVDPMLRLRQRSFTPLAEWEGYVESIEDERFTVRLVDIKSGAQLADEEATFSKSELSGSQRDRLQLGAIVRWVVGLERLYTDQRRRVSELHFRRLPVHSKKDFARSFDKAQSLIDEINWDDAS